MHKKTISNIIYILILIISICFLFGWYSNSNRRQIEEHNLTYAMDSTHQKSKAIGNEFANAQRRVHNYAYCLSMGETALNIDANMLKGLEDNAVFDAIDRKSVV